MRRSHASAPRLVRWCHLRVPLRLVVRQNPRIRGRGLTRIRHEGQARLQRKHLRFESLQRRGAGVFTAEHLARHTAAHHCQRGPAAVLQACFFIGPRPSRRSRPSEGAARACRTRRQAMRRARRCRPCPSRALPVVVATAWPSRRNSSRVPVLQPLQSRSSVMVLMACVAMAVLAVGFMSGVSGRWVLGDAAGCAQAASTTHPNKAALMHRRKWVERHSNEGVKTGMQLSKDRHCS